MNPTEPCPVPMERSLGALRAEALALRPALDALPLDTWSRPTRLEAWNVRQLLVHLTRAYDRIVAYVRAPEPLELDLGWLDYYRTAMAEARPTEVAQRTIEQAGDRTPTDIVSAYQTATDTAVQVAEEAGPGRVIQSPFGPIRLDHYLTSRVVEATVHGLDLRAALDLEEVATPLGLSVTAAVLDGLLGGPRPVDLDRDDLAWILAATGRHPHDDPELPVIA